MMLIFADALLLILDMAMWLLDGRPGSLVRAVYITVTAFYYVFNPLICMIWYFYVDYQIYRSKRHLKRILFPMIIPVCINLVLSILSIFQEYMFFFDESNIYHRGPLFLIMALISLFYLAASMILITIKKDKIPKHDFMPLLIFAIPPLIGGIIQTIFYGIALVWVCATLSALIIFINIQNDQLYTDYLTGLFNRRQLDNYLKQKCQNTEPGMLAGIMIDINSFKEINDLYGHDIGDQALCDTAEILKKTFREKDFVARYGGDEFVVLMTIRDKTKLLHAVNQLKRNVEIFNEQGKAPYQIGLSLGYDFLPDTETSPTDFLKHIDKLMYQNKPG